MKRVLCVILLFLLTLQGTCVFAEESTMNEYTVSYFTGSDTEIESSVITGRSEMLELEISRVQPKKEGFEFLGWSYSPQDYVNTPVLQPGEAVKLSSSVELYALWRNPSVKKIQYMDGQQEILPAQLTTDGVVQISELVPQKNGYTFSGWSHSTPDGSRIILPGELLKTDGSAVLIARWERGSIESPDLQTVESISGGVIFECSNAASYDEAILTVRSLENGSQTDYTFRDGSVRIDNLPDGAYCAQVAAEKYGIRYIGKPLNVVIAGKTEIPENPLRVFMDGKELTFDLPPVLLDGHTFVTLRYFCEYLGANVLWDDENRTAIITYKGTRMKIKENSDVCVVDGASFQLPAKTVIMSSRLFIPLRSVAELCSCEVVWDPSKKVYMFSDPSSIFDNTVFSVSSGSGKYLSLADGELVCSEVVDFGGMWIFDTVDEEKGIYEIYNFCNMTAPLEVKTSEMIEGQPLRLWEKSGYDGYLWKVTDCGGGEYLIQPANHSGLYLDAENMRITTDKTTVYLNGVYR